MSAHAPPPLLSDDDAARAQQTAAYFLGELTRTIGGAFDQALDTHAVREQIGAGARRLVGVAREHVPRLLSGFKAGTRSMADGNGVCIRACDTDRLATSLEEMVSLLNPVLGSMSTLERCAIAITVAAVTALILVALCVTVAVGCWLLDKHTSKQGRSWSLHNAFDGGHAEQHQANVKCKRCSYVMHNGGPGPSASSQSHTWRTRASGTGAGRPSPSHSGEHKVSRVLTPAPPRPPRRNVGTDALQYTNSDDLVNMSMRATMPTDNARKRNGVGASYALTD